MLDEEQSESVLSLAQALDEINEGEAMAHIDIRLAFVERQIERLAARRDEADRGMQGEFSIMRARLEDALEAVGVTSTDQRDAVLGLEKKLMASLTDIEDRATETVNHLRADLVQIVQDASARFDKSEGHLRGELIALETGVEERTRSAAAEAERLELLTAKLDERASRIEVDASKRMQRFEDLAAQTEVRMDSKAAEVEARVIAKTAELEVAAQSMAEQTRESIDLGFEELKSNIEARLLSNLSANRSSLAAFQERVDALIDTERREIHARISESQADVRIDIHQLKEAVEQKMTSFAEAVELVRGDLFSRIKSSEDKAAGAAVHLESTIARGEQEWGAALQDLTRDLSDMKIRSEELFARMGTIEGVRANQRDDSSAAVGSLSARLDALDNRVRQLIEEALARQATRVEVLASQVASMSEAGSAEDERSGAVNYVSRKVAEMGQRFDELTARVAVLGQSMTTASGRMPEVVEVVPAELDERISTLEQRIAVLANQPRQDTVAEGLRARVESLERQTGEMHAHSQVPSDLTARIDTIERVLSGLAAKPQSGSASNLVERLNALERSLTNIPATLTSRQAELAARVDELEKRVALSSHILPDKRKRGIWPA
ncbi:MAG: hypothetical protein LC723_10135 [Actinobacteria bacterium]|nr:hypothetical protein [Actinomycetota bacterium]